MAELGRQVGALIDISNEPGKLVADVIPVHDEPSPNFVVKAVVISRRSGVDYVGSAAESGTEPDKAPEVNEWMASLPA
ncbi:MAG: hypothetical protein V4702_03900 [Patescibacteria group bacterium]